MDKKSFILYSSQWDALRHLTDEQLGRTMRQVFEYVTEGQEPTAPEVAFLFIRAQLDKDMDKYAEHCRQKAEAGRIGMAKRWGKPVTPITSVTSDITEITPVISVNNTITDDNRDNRGITAITDNDNDNDNDIFKEKDISIDISKKKFNFRSALIKDCNVSETVTDDYIAYRKGKKAAVSKTLFNSLVRESKEAGISVETALTFTMERGWQGFCAAWYLKHIKEQTYGNNKDNYGTRHDSATMFTGTPKTEW